MRGAEASGGSGGFPEGGDGVGCIDGGARAEVWEVVDPLRPALRLPAEVQVRTH
ncbi:hypothetical protein [Limisphaera sp. VF-2]|uniref:hypothetical protein n=1 Tax=Limisphaera sp. VF-2 TaxID=3400418 RepID=UPI002564217A|nr:hypothetical protein [Limisphaera sp.]